MMVGKRQVGPCQVLLGNFSTIHLAVRSISGLKKIVQLFQQKLVSLESREGSSKKEVKNALSQVIPDESSQRCPLTLSLL